MAYHEMRIILARILWDFDLELGDRMEGWERQTIFGIWEKPPLMVKVSKRGDLKGKVEE